MSEMERSGIELISDIADITSSGTRQQTIIPNPYPFLPFKQSILYHRLKQIIKKTQIVIRKKKNTQNVLTKERMFAKMIFITITYLPKHMEGDINRWLI